MAEFNPYQRDRSYVETGSCLMVWRRLMKSILFCFSLLSLNIYLLKGYHQIEFFTESLCLYENEEKGACSQTSKQATICFPEFRAPLSNP